MKATDDFRLRCMHLALDNIARDADNGPGDRLEWDPGRAFVLEQIRQMRIVFKHYEKEVAREERGRA